MPRTYLVECYETTRLYQSIEVDDSVPEDGEDFIADLIEKAQARGNWEEESLGTDGTRVSRESEEGTELIYAADSGEEEEDA